MLHDVCKILQLSSIDCKPHGKKADWQSSGLVDKQLKDNQDFEFEHSESWTLIYDWKVRLVPSGVARNFSRGGFGNFLCGKILGGIFRLLSQKP